ncbi:MAG TPA: hypothetical protein VIM98_16190 [Dyella sp.]|uniref:hypothetical protein n=1 Tax=Dyella sp. TaxID=1869338 RepID=UPI002F92E5F0
MRWILLTATVFALVLCFTRHGAGAMALWLVLGIVGLIATVLAFAQERIGAHARDDSTLSEYDLQQLRAGKQPLKHQR